MNIDWIGHDGIRITSDNLAIYIDPYQLEDGGAPADILLISHEHFDHCSLEDIEKSVVAVRENTPVTIAHVATVSLGPALRRGALDKEGAEAVGDLTDVARNLSSLTRGLLEGRGTLGQLVVDEQLYERLVGLAESLDTLVASAASPDGALMRMLTDDTLYAAVRSAVTSFDTLTRSVVEGEGTLGQLVRSDSLYRELTGTVSRADSLLAGLLAGEGSAGRMFNDEELYEELLRTLVELNGMLEDVRRDPSRYVPEISVF